MTRIFPFLKESEKMALESQIESIIKWVKEERSGTTEDSTLIVAEAEKKLLKLKREYNRLIRDYNKKMLSKNQGGRLFKRIKFGDEAKPRREWQALDRNMEECIARILFVLIL